MFTGIVTDIGRVIAFDGAQLTLGRHADAGPLAIGGSVACDGCCLTVTWFERRGPETVFTADVSRETLSKTTLGDWTPGRPVNLESALRAGAELGGHLVAGHIDGRAEIIDIQPDGPSHRFSLAAPNDLAPFIAVKGSIALDGVSLTINDAMHASFGVTIIPHTLTATTWGRKKPGDQVNVEVDLVARYVARLIEFRP